MSATIKHTFLPSNPIYFAAFSRKFLTVIPYPARTQILRKGFVKCSPDNRDESGANLKDALSSSLAEQVEELLTREENRVLFDDLEKASMRVEMAERQLAEIEKQELELKRFKAHINELENRASEIAGCQREILEARAMIEQAERSLSQNENGDVVTNGEIEGLDRNEERLESVRAASISAIVGTLAGLPIFLTQVTNTSQLLLPISITLISCALFGVTFRYAVRGDVDNIQLKTGTSAAFAFVKGLGTLEGGRPLELSTVSLLSHALDGAVYISENLYIFISAAVALDYCFKMRFLSPFPIKRSISKG